MKSLAAIVAALALAACANHQAAPDPHGAASGAPAVAAASAPLAEHAKAPDAMLTTPSGTQVALADSWRGRKGAVVVFYRGFF